MDQVIQLALEMRNPARHKSFHWQPGVCYQCGQFSFRTARFKILTPKVSSPRYCNTCMPRGDVVVAHNRNNRHRLSATSVVQLISCPKSYQLSVEHPEQPTSPENAFGTLYHLGRENGVRRSFKSLATFRYAPRVGLKALLERFNDQRLFRHGINRKNDWEIPTLRYLLEQVLLALWHRGQLTSMKLLSTALAQKGTTTVWWASELRLPPTKLGEDFFLTGTTDLIILRRYEGRYQVKIVDHKIRGVDVHPELQGADCWLQLRLYACWAVLAFAELGVVPEDISLWVYELSLNPIKIEKKTTPFNEEVHGRTLETLQAVLKRLKEYRHTSFPAKPEPWLCQSCDFGLNRKLCPQSQAQRDAWNLGVPFVPLGSRPRDDR